MNEDDNASSRVCILMTITVIAYVVVAFLFGYWLGSLGRALHDVHSLPADTVLV